MYKVDVDGSNPVLIGTDVTDVAGGGNPPNTFNFTGISAQTLSNQRILVCIRRESDDGKTITMGYNPKDVFKTALTTPAAQ